MNYEHIWRHPGEETEDYPKFPVWDDCQSGSITAGHSRLPLWAFIYETVLNGLNAQVGEWSVNDNYGVTDYVSVEELGSFLVHLLEARGEFGRLLCVLADVERLERVRDEDDGDGWPNAWWKMPDLRNRVRAQLQSCMDALDEIANERQDEA